jgi:hypothetical protein
MPNSEELQQKGTIGVEKRLVVRGGKISFSERVGGINNVFGPKPIGPLFVIRIQVAYIEPIWLVFVTKRMTVSGSGSKNHILCGPRSS